MKLLHFQKCTEWNKLLEVPEHSRIETTTHICSLGVNVNCRNESLNDILGILGSCNIRLVFAINKLWSFVTKILLIVIIILNEHYHLWPAPAKSHFYLSFVYEWAHYWMYVLIYINILYISLCMTIISRCILHNVICILAPCTYGMFDIFVYCIYTR